LAATQVNVHKRIIVLDTSEDKNNPLCLINPEIIEQMGKEESDDALHT
jgi:peptide deformylase